MTDQTETTQTAEQISAQETDDLSAGYQKAQSHRLPPSGDTAPQAETKVETKAEAKTETKAEGTAQAAEVKADATAEKKTLIAGMTEDELKDALAKTGTVKEEVSAEIRKAFSKIGEVNRTVQDLAKKLSAGTASRKFTAEALKRVNEELPGLGEALAADLNSIFDAPAVAAAQEQAEAKGEKFDPEAYFAEKLAPALQAFEARTNERAEMRIARSVHRDFETVVKSEEFSKWLKTLPPEKEKEYRESEDGLVAADAVSEFKDWKTKAAKKAAGKKERLENAITPQGSGQAPAQKTQDDEADFASGYKKAAKK